MDSRSMIYKKWKNKILIKSVEHEQAEVCLKNNN